MAEVEVKGNGRNFEIKTARFIKFGRRSAAFHERINLTARNFGRRFVFYFYTDKFLL